MESKPLIKLLALFLIIAGLIIISETLIWILTGGSFFGWHSGGIIEHTGNLILGIWTLIIGYKDFTSSPNQENQWSSNLYILFIGVKMIAEDIYHFLDGQPDTYSNPISVFFGFIIIGFQAYLLIHRKQKNTEDLEANIDIPNKINPLDN
ncbi:MAG: hypothetical protein QNJ47_22365 [Nostocaceae cyanobacterium]|nr:hypothetical protein [Nostocaceae cyanobacterium]